MFGTLRFVLALLVLESHVFSGSTKSFNPGVFAVVSFFLLTGYVVTGVVRRHALSPPRIALFYADRLLRIGPQFWFVCLATLLLAPRIAYRDYFLGPNLDHLSVRAVLLNLAILPLGLFRFNAVGQCILSPPSWSLGLESMFYLCLPWLLKGNLARSVFWASLGVFALAAVGVLETALWGYYLLPGTLFLFLSGSLLYEAREAFLRRTLPLVAVFLVGTLVVAALRGKLGVPFTREIVAGYGFALLALTQLAHRPRRAWDEWLGTLSFGVFLWHPLVIWLVGAAGLRERAGTLLWVLGIVGASVSLAWVGHALVERPALRLQRRLRSRYETI